MLEYALKLHTGKKQDSTVTAVAHDYPYYEAQRYLGFCSCKFFMIQEPFLHF